MPIDVPALVLEVSRFLGWSDGPWSPEQLRQLLQMCLIGKFRYDDPSKD